jgi:hypothetical protein
MNVKTFGCAGEHAGGRPLPRPEANRRECPLILPGKLAKEPAVTLNEDAPGEDLDSWNPRGLQFSRLAGDFAYLHAAGAQPFGDSARAIVTLA